MNILFFLAAIAAMVLLWPVVEKNFTASSWQEAVKKAIGIGIFLGGVVLLTGFFASFYQTASPLLKVGEMVVMLVIFFLAVNRLKKLEKKEVIIFLGIEVLALVFYLFNQGLIPQEIFMNIFAGGLMLLAIIWLAMFWFERQHPIFALFLGGGIVAAIIYYYLWLNGNPWTSPLWRQGQPWLIIYSPLIITGVAFLVLFIWGKASPFWRKTAELSLKMTLLVFVIGGSIVVTAMVSGQVPPSRLAQAVTYNRAMADASQARIVAVSRQSGVDYFAAKIRAVASLLQAGKISPQEAERRIAFYEAMEKAGQRQLAKTYKSPERIDLAAMFFKEYVNKISPYWQRIRGRLNNL